MDVANKPPKPRISAEIVRLLSALRWRIRTYVWLEGISVAVVWVGLTFWASLAVDYLPVLLGASEMPREARAVLLAVIAIVLAWILYRWVFRRTFVRMPNRSMAMLLERRFGHFKDGLITSVELNGTEVDPDTSERMLSQTQTEAVGSLRQVRLSSVFDARPLAFSLIGAVVLTGSVGLFYAAQANAFRIGVERIYGLGDTPWPRNAKIEVIGVSVPQSSQGSDEAVRAKLVSFVDQNVKVARGASVTLTVRADGAAKVVPEVCTIYYRTAEGDRGRVNMTRVGRIRDGFQTYSYNGKPLKGILSTVTFDVVGYDHRLRGYTMQVVDAPAVVAADLRCNFPKYMVNEELGLWLPRDVALSSGSQLPIGTDVTIIARSNKPLREVRVFDTHTEKPTTLHVDALDDDKHGFAIPLGKIHDNVSLEVTLIDTDDVASERSHRIYIGAIEDQAPTIDISLLGVGTAVTPDVLIPIQGTVRDDYGVARSWFEVMVGDGESHELPLVVAAASEVSAEIDFRTRRGEGDVAIKAGDTLNLTVKAADRCDLQDPPNVGVSDHYQLEVVTPDELLSRLESRELGLRKRFEQVVTEVSEMRDSLVRVKTEGPEAETPGADPADGGSEADQVDVDSNADNSREAAEAAIVKRKWALRLLRSQRAIFQSQKSAQETLGIAASFEDIRAELINNRVETEDRKERLQNKIADPLNQIGQTLFPELDTRLATLVGAMDKNIDALAATGKEDADTVAHADAALEQANVVLLAMHDVLDNMLDLESFNELLDLVRGIIHDQERMIIETKKQQKKQLLDFSE
ncbi:MAG: hypothetical protein QF918_10920 [Pirellulaceae bacterium]|nr:hypothetical protein [Pirellulaceae bacterium]